MAKQNLRFHESPITTTALNEKQAQPFTVADYLLTRLKQLNVTDVFQIPGDYVKHFTQALEYFDGVNAIGAINELDAAYAADAYGRTRGLGAVSLQYGVSTFSALNAIAGAYVELSPVVVISACPGADARQIGKMYDVLYHHSTGNLQADQEVYSRVTVAAITLSTSVGAADAIDNLLIAAITHKKPVYIACYKEVWGEPCPQPSKEPLKPQVIKSDLLALQNAVAQAWAQISVAKNPMLFPLLSNSLMMQADFCTPQPAWAKQCLTKGATNLWAPTPMRPPLKTSGTWLPLPIVSLRWEP
jgi:indolepyruvate decarboxylase